MNIPVTTPALHQNFNNIDEQQKVKVRSVMSQLLSDAVDRCETLVKVQSMLHDPKYAQNGSKVAHKIEPKLTQWMDTYSAEQLKARNSDSKMFTDLKYLITDTLEKDGTEDKAKTQMLMNDFNQTTGGLKSNYDTHALLNSGENLKRKMDDIQNIVSNNRSQMNTVQKPTISSHTTQPVVRTPIHPNTAQSTIIQKPVNRISSIPAQSQSQ
jgi:hypothetical protein